MIPKMNFARYAFVMATVVLTATWASAEPASEAMIAGITQPMRRQEAKLQLNQIGIVKELAIKPGDHVRKGQLLVALDSSVEEAKWKEAELEAKNPARIEDAEATLKVKKVVLKRKESAEKGSFSPSEIEEAQLDVIDAQAKLDIAHLEQEKAKLEAEGEKNRVRQMTLLSPFDGVVESIDTSIGEIVSPQADRPVCTIVQNDPVSIEIRNMPAVQAGKLKIGDKLEVRYDDRYIGTPVYEQRWAQAQVVYKAPVADAASDTQLVRLEMPNTRNVDSGLQVVVKLPPSIANNAAAAAATEKP